MYRKIRGHGCLRTLLFKEINIRRIAKAFKKEFEVTYEIYEDTVI